MVVFCFAFFDRWLWLMCVSGGGGCGSVAVVCAEGRMGGQCGCGWWCVFSVCDCCFLLYCCAQSGGPGTECSSSSPAPATSSSPRRECSSGLRVAVAAGVLVSVVVGGSWVLCVGPA